MVKREPKFQWCLERNLEKSKLLGPAPKAVLAKINHADPEPIVEMIVTTMDDTEDRVLFRGLTNGEEVANPRSRHPSSESVELGRYRSHPALWKTFRGIAANRRVWDQAVFESIPQGFSPAFDGGLSRLVHQRAARKPISDARIAACVILSTGSGPGGRFAEVELSFPD
jgi:hypothetical protein